MQIIEAGEIAKQVVCDCGSTDFLVTIKPHEIRLHCKHCTNVITVKNSMDVDDLLDAASDGLVGHTVKFKVDRVNDNSKPFGFDPETGYSTDEDWG